MNLTIATLGIENQSSIDENEPIRVMGYDYVQIVDEKKLHPVITMCTVAQGLIEKGYPLAKPKKYVKLFISLQFCKNGCIMTTK